MNNTIEKTVTTTTTVETSNEALQASEKAKAIQDSQEEQKSWWESLVDWTSETWNGWFGEEQEALKNEVVETQLETLKEKTTENKLLEEKAKAEKEVAESNKISEFFRSEYSDLISDSSEKISLTPNQFIWNIPIDASSLPKEYVEAMPPVIMEVRDGVIQFAPQRGNMKQSVSFNFNGKREFSQTELIALLEQQRGYLEYGIGSDQQTDIFQSSSTNTTNIINRTDITNTTDTTDTNTTDTNTTDTNTTNTTTTDTTTTTTTDTSTDTIPVEPGAITDTTDIIEEATDCCFLKDYTEFAEEDLNQYKTEVDSLHHPSFQEIEEDPEVLMDGEENDISEVDIKDYSAPQNVPKAVEKKVSKKIQRLVKRYNNVSREGLNWNQIKVIPQGKEEQATLFQFDGKNFIQDGNHINYNMDISYPKRDFIRFIKREEF